jgi:nucleoside-diphosphate-sugar epimerase|tara:strand:+ start:565 stop:741 length:177 start_codon:yes stop_codon:yes gene_type:complete
MERILITVGSGFLGIELALKLKNNYEVILGSRNSGLNQEADHHSQEEKIGLIKLGTFS